MTALTKNPSRRGAIMAALASVPVLALPAVTMAAGVTHSHPDADLFALIEAARDLHARWDAACEVGDEAEDRTEYVPWPQALIVTDDDTRLWKLKAGDPFDLTHLDLMRRRQAHRQNLKSPMSSFVAIAANAPYVATLPEKDRALVEMGAATEVREVQLIAALDQWNEAQDEAKVRSGEFDAWRRADELFVEEKKLKAQIGATSAQTVAGIMAKLAFVARYIDVDDRSLFDDDGATEQVLLSVAIDYADLHSQEEGART